MLNPQQFLNLIIRPACEFLEPEIPHLETAERLLMGTALMESNLTYLMQLNNGPALGVFQMEPATHDDIWENWLRFRLPIHDRILSRWGSLDAHRMVHDLHYAAVMARLHYRRVPQALPRPDDLRAQAAYWKRWYNTALGKGDAATYCDVWARSPLARCWG